MIVIAVDDEKLALSATVRVLQVVFENAVIQGFGKCKDTIEYAEQLHSEGKVLDYAFLDIEMRQMTGMELARQLKTIFPKIRIIFITAHDQYALEAYKLHAKGYLLKPVSVEEVKETLEAMEVSWKSSTIIERKKRIRIHTFGNFDVYADDISVTFERSKAKELLAYLVDRAGAGVTTTEIGAVLWEDKEYDKNMKNQTQKVISALFSALKAINAENILIKKWNYLAIDPEQVECDYFNFLNGDIDAVNSYMGEYMSNYSWTEFTTASLYERTKKAF